MGGPPAAEDRLRRLDFRFLLPEPRLGSVAVVGGPDDVLLAALGEHAERVAAEPADAVGRGFDTVVLRGPTADRLRLAGRLVAPDGWVIVEPDRGARVGRIPGARRGAAAGTLEPWTGTGLEAVRRSWHWPTVARAQEVVPLDEPRSMKLFLARRHSDRQAGIKALGARLLHRAGLLDRIVASWSIVARPLGAAAEPLRRDRLPEGLLVTPRFIASRHVVRLVPGEDGRIERVEKIARRTGDRETLGREAAALQLVRGAFGTSGAVPRLIEADMESPHPRLVETGVAGRAIGTREVRSGRPHLVEAAVDFVLALPRGEPQPAAAVIGPAAERLGMAAAGRHPDVVELIDRTTRVLDPLAGARLPAILEHGDLAAPNVLALPDGRLGAIDWELADPAGLPLTDLVFFLAFAGAASASGRDDQAFRRTFAEPDRWVRGAVGRYAQELGLPGKLLQGLFVATWLRWADRQVGRLAIASADALALLAGTRHVARWRAAVELVEADRLRWLEGLGS